MHLVLVPLLLAVGWTEGSLTDWTVSHLDEKSSAEHMHAEAVASLPSSFRLGSGAPLVDKLTPSKGTLMKAEWPKSGSPKSTGPQVKAELPKPVNDQKSPIFKALIRSH